MPLVVAIVTFLVVLSAETYVLAAQPQWLLFYTPFRLPQERRVALDSHGMEPVDAGYRDAAERPIVPVPGRAPDRLVVGTARDAETELVAAKDQSFFALRGTVGRHRKKHFVVRIDAKQEGGEVVLSCRQGLTQWFTPLAALPLLVALFKVPMVALAIFFVFAPLSVWMNRSGTRDRRDAAIEEAFDVLESHLSGGAGSEP